jgi:hypothetical protein
MDLHCHVEEFLESGKVGFFLLLKAIQNFKISHDMPGFDIFNFLLPRDQIDDILNLEVDIN